MSKTSYYIDNNAVSVNVFRESQERVDAENYLVPAYREAIGDISCQEHQQGPGFALHFSSETGECRIKTEACCPAFDHTMNAALIAHVTAEA